MLCSVISNYTDVPARGRSVGSLSGGSHHVRLNKVTFHGLCPQGLFLELELERQSSWQTRYVRGFVFPSSGIALTVLPFKTDDKTSGHQQTAQTYDAHPDVTS